MENIVGMSKLEAVIMLIVWDRSTVTNREVYEAFLKEEIRNKKSGFIPYTTFMSTMNSLARKKILKIDRSRKTYTYSAVLDRKEPTNSRIMSVEEKLIS